MSGTGTDDRETAMAEAAASSIVGMIDEEEWRRPSALERVQRTLHKYPALGPFIVLVVMVVGFSLMAPDRFMGTRNLSLIVSQVMVVGTLAIGQTIIILTAGVDLSVGAIAVFA